MSLSFTSDDLTRLERANRVLLSPLAAPDSASWLRDAGSVVRDLLQADAVVTLAPGEAQTFESDDAPEVKTGAAAYVEAMTAEGVRFRDPVVEAWHHMRRRTNLVAFCRDINLQMVTEQGYRPYDSGIIGEVVEGNAYFDFAGLLKTTTAGDAMIWVLQHRAHAFRFDQDVAAVLRALAPSFLASLDVLTRLRDARQALDARDEPLVVFEAGARECHRTPALERLLAADPERARVDAEVRALATRLDALAFPLRGNVPATPDQTTERTVATARQTYTLRGSLLPAGLFTADGGVMISLIAAAGVRLPEPGLLRERYGLTRREAEVALLLAEGLANDALADRLFISPHTARRHTEQVLGKLGLTSRKALALKLMQDA